MIETRSSELVSEKSFKNLPTIFNLFYISLNQTGSVIMHLQIVDFQHIVQAAYALELKYNLKVIGGRTSFYCLSLG